MGPLEGLTADQVKQYIRFIGNRRLEQLGLNPIYDVKKNPLTWLDTMLNGVEHMNFLKVELQNILKLQLKERGAKFCLIFEIKLQNILEKIWLKR